MQARGLTLGAAPTNAHLTVICYFKLEVFWWNIQICYAFYSAYLLNGLKCNFFILVNAFNLTVKKKQNLWPEYVMCKCIFIIFAAWLDFLSLSGISIILLWSAASCYYGKGS